MPISTQPNGKINGAASGPLFLCAFANEHSRGHSRFFVVVGASQKLMGGFIFRGLGLEFPRAWHLRAENHTRITSLSGASCAGFPHSNQCSSCGGALYGGDFLFIIEVELCNTTTNLAFLRGTPKFFPSSSHYLAFNPLSPTARAMPQQAPAPAGPLPAWAMLKGCSPPEEVGTCAWNANCAFR